jgi:hypothetical protein
MTLPVGPPGDSLKLDRNAPINVDELKNYISTIGAITLFDAAAKIELALDYVPSPQESDPPEWVFQTLGRRLEIAAFQF